VVDNTKAVVGKKKAEHQKTLHMLNKHWSITLPIFIWMAVLTSRTCMK
jgi:hypothetical protein